MKNCLITGSSGLIGSTAVNLLCKDGWQVVGIDNNMRGYFFGKDGSTESISTELTSRWQNYTHYSIDIRDEQALENIFKEHVFDLIIHAAAQPSHDWAVNEPKTDFTVNAIGTLNMLEATKKFAPDAVFIFTSTNKVYGDTPNYLPLLEQETRYTIEENHPFAEGIDETMPIDHTLHSLFGVSKTSADLLVQEYGRYFGLKTGIFRAGCITGSMHSAVPLHGFLSYLTKCIVHEEHYKIIGYKGKQVRDNIHAADLVYAMLEFFKQPKIAAVYNIGGGVESNCSVIEAISLIEAASGKKAITTYEDIPRSGDHMWYISNISRFKNDYPNWKYTYSLPTIVEELVTHWQEKFPYLHPVVNAKSITA